MTNRFRLGLEILVVGLLGIGPIASAQLPTFDRTNPVVYDNDACEDTYTDDYLMALASTGSISLKGVITSSTQQPYNHYVDADSITHFYGERDNDIAAAAASGFRNTPTHVHGSTTALTPPGNGQIDSTTPTSTAGSTLIRTQANLASVAKPLLVVVGGPLTTVANAYLLEPSIASKIIVLYGGGMSATDFSDYNTWSDGWAAYIVMSRMTTVAFAAGMRSPIHVTKATISANLPASPLKTFMLAKLQVTSGLPEICGCDGDSTQAVAVMLPTYSTSVVRSSVTGLVGTRVFYPQSHKVPVLAANASGNVYVVTVVDSAAGTVEWFRAMTNPAAYARHRSSLSSGWISAVSGATSTWPAGRGCVPAATRARASTSPGTPGKATGGCA